MRGLNREVCKMKIEVGDTVTITNLNIPVNCDCEVVDIKYYSDREEDVFLKRLDSKGKDNLIVSVFDVEKVN